MLRRMPFFAVLAFVFSILTPSAASAQFWQCVTYARAASGIEIRGNANTWWNQAAGRYERGNVPRPGAVMAMPRHAGMGPGHVAMVSKIVSDREILLDHANWSRRGQIEKGVRAVDVSEKGDWSRVRIWYARNGDLGTTAYPAHGFIYPNAVENAPFAAPAIVAQPTLRGPLIGEDVIRLAMLERAPDRLN